MRLPAVLAITGKDIVDAIRNTNLLFTLILPVVISLLLRVVVTEPVLENTLEIALYDPGSSRLVEQLQSFPGVTVIPVQSAEEVAEQVKGKEVDGGLRLPAHFDQAVEAGEKPEVEVYYNGEGEINMQMALQRLVEEALRAMAGQDLPAQLVFTDVTGLEIREEKQAENPGIILKRFYLVLFLIMGQALVGNFVVPTLLVEEKEKRTLQAILVSPASYSDVIAGKALVGMFYALLVTLLLLFLNGGFMGNIGLTLLSAVLGALFLVQVGLFMGALANNTTQVNTWSSLVMLVMLIPSMFSTVLFSPSEPIQTMLRFIPTYYTADAVALSLAGEAALSDVGRDLAILTLATMAVTGGIIWVLRRERR